MFLFFKNKKKNVCTTCAVDTFSSTKQTTLWLCKICGEYKDVNEFFFWKSQQEIESKSLYSKFIHGSFKAITLIEKI